MLSVCQVFALLSVVSEGGKEKVKSENKRDRERADRPMCVSFQNK